MAGMQLEDYIEGVVNGQTAVLAKAVTLVESNAERHQLVAQELLKSLLPRSGRSIRIGITGVPGAGKSTFIDVFGQRLCQRGHKVAVLAIDPSSAVSRGSILGDKTRMELLSREPNCFIRPSPSGGNLGGVARKTRETIVVCEAAGYDVIIVETVGVGQTEVAVRSLVDFFLLLSITGAGDELQTFKKGIIELADLIVINKADGDNLTRAHSQAAEFNQVLRYLTSFTPSWRVDARTCSALTGEGLNEIWEVIELFVESGRSSGVFANRRQEQIVEWFDELLIEKLKCRFHENKAVREHIAVLRQQVAQGSMPAALAVEKAMEISWG